MSRDAKHQPQTAQGKRRTPGCLTRYEYVRLIADRAQELQDGKRPLIPTDASLTDSLKIAEAELRAGVLPLRLPRQLPDGTIELCDPNTMLTHFDIC